MVALPRDVLANMLDVAIWDVDQPLGVCSLDHEGKLAVYADQSERQDEFAELLDIEYALQKKRERQAGNTIYDDVMFLADLPQILRGYVAAQRVSQPRIELPEHIALKPFDRATIPTQPRRKRRQVA
jgi:hypothetical protein